MGVNPIILGLKNYLLQCGYPQKVFFMMDWLVSGSARWPEGAVNVAASAWHRTRGKYSDKRVWNFSMLRRQVFRMVQCEEIEQSLLRENFISGIDDGRLDKSKGLSLSPTLIW